MVGLINSRREKLEEYNAQLLNAGIMGMLKGTLIGLLSGFYFNYRYNHGHNTKFFNTPYKVGYLVCWNIAGIIFSTDVARLKISKELAIDEEIRRNMYIDRELEGKSLSSSTKG